MSDRELLALADAMAAVLHTYPRAEHHAKLVEIDVVLSRITGVRCLT